MGLFYCLKIFYNNLLQVVVTFCNVVKRYLIMSERRKLNGQTFSEESPCTATITMAPRVNKFVNVYHHNVNTERLKNGKRKINKEQAINLLIAVGIKHSAHITLRPFEEDDFNAMISAMLND